MMKFLLFFIGLPSVLLAADPAITIYNGNFGVIRETIPLTLKEGVNAVRFHEITVHLEPDSVILRDSAGKVDLQVLEQSFRNDPVSQGRLLSLFEGKELDFLVNTPTGERIVHGKVIRSGYTPHSAQAIQRYGRAYQERQMGYAYGSGIQTDQPIIEVDGQMRFSLPGQPLFPALSDESILKPELTWKLRSSQTANLQAEIGYVTGGMSWEADYNLVAPKEGNIVDLVGWVTMDNQSGRSFPNARIKLMAGDVSKIQQEGEKSMGYASGSGALMKAGPPTVTEKSFDDFHLYTLANPATLLDRETKQVEFVRAAEVQSTRFYVYEGALYDWNRWGRSDIYNRRQQDDFMGMPNPKVWIMREFKNSEENGLGIPLPKGRLRFYQRDTDGQLEFVGENMIDHTPRNEMIRANLGNAFDLVGQHKRTNIQMDQSAHWVDETFEITLRNRKKESVEIRVVEHLYRWTNWEIRDPSTPFTKQDAETIEFRVALKPDEEKKVTYLVHYSW